MLKMRNIYTVLVIQPEGKRPHVRPRHKWEDSMKMDLKEVGWVGADWIHLTCDGDCWWILVNI
jgi:hypothetical protein